MWNRSHIETPYVRFGLRENPFPDKGAEEYRNMPEKLEIFLFEHEKAKLQRWTKEATDRAIDFAVIGPWGTGKSLFLIYMYRLLREAYGPDRVQFIYIHAPSSSEDILRGICEELGLKNNCTFDTIKSRLLKLVEEERIVYIAIDQFEEIWRILRENKSELYQVVELLRGKLYALAERRYVLGLGCIDLEWHELSSAYKELEAFNKIELRLLSERESLQRLTSTGQTLLCSQKLNYEKNIR